MVRAGGLEVREAAELVRRARRGDPDAIGPTGFDAQLVVDLDTPGELPPIGFAPSCPWVVVGVGDPSVGSGSLAGVDLALTGSARPPRPWVGVGDLDAELERLAGANATAPMASLVLAQVLRITGQHGLSHDLVAESLAYSTLQSGPEFARWLAAQDPPGRTALRSAAAAGDEADEGDEIAEGCVVLVERRDDRLELTLNRPRVRNAFSAAVRDQLCESLAVAAADPSIAEVHLWGNGPDFCSGGDLTEFGTAPDPVTAHLVRTARSAAALLGQVGERVVAHLHGACIGAGIELPAVAGRVIAEADTRVQLPEVAMGLIPGAGGTASLPRRIGRHRTAWLALSGRAIDAATAHDWGLVDELTP